VAVVIADGSPLAEPYGRVGIGLEAHCFDLDDPWRQPDRAELTAIISGLPVLPGGSAVTVEPGGAVGLSGSADGPQAAIALLCVDWELVRTAFAESGLGLALLGADPRRPSGVAMTTSTASVRVNLHAGPRPDWAARVRLAYALGPAMIAIAANSPMIDGQFTGWRSTRYRARPQTVRICGHRMEIRYLDSVPDSLWPGLVFMLVTLLDDPEAARFAADVVSPVATAWDLAARIGLADSQLHDAAERCVGAVETRTPAELSDSMGLLVRNVERARCPADEFVDDVIRYGIGQAMRDSALGLV